MNEYPLPPLVGGFEDGQVIWQRLKEVDYNTLGYLLSCHLIIEHYMDHFLASWPGMPKLDWDGAKLTFGQKVALISNLKFAEPYDLPPIIKHLNSLRNRFSRKINMRLTDQDMLPFRRFILKCVQGEEDRVPLDAKDVLQMFTTMVCAYMASSISFMADYSARAGR